MFVLFPGLCLTGEDKLVEREGVVVGETELASSWKGFIGGEDKIKWRSVRVRNRVRKGQRGHRAGRRGWQPAGFIVGHLRLSPE